RNSLYAVALVLFGVLLYVVSLSRQGNENTLLDYTYTYLSEINIRTSEIYLPKTAISKQKRNETSLKFGGFKKIYYLCTRKKDKIMNGLYT
ncbi:hypothetical protein OSL50_26370, partial [Escherichia coli]|nr:hypothetical protein [Escherichia coli]